MGALTFRARALSQGKPHEALIDAMIDELPDDAHIEYVQGKGTLTPVSPFWKIRDLEDDVTVKNRLLAFLVFVPIMQHSFIARANDAAETRTQVQADNEAVARAYKVAIDKFVIELSGDLKRDGGMEDRLALLRNYQSTVYAEDDGFCISFSPFSLKGEMFFGGSTTYCFDKEGVTLKKVLWGK